LRKIAAILLLALIVFNTIGYKFLFNYLQKKADATLDAKLDKGAYNDNDLVTVKFPLNLPYQNNWQDFERTIGEVTINGQNYKYVKRKVTNDTLYLLCIRHDIKTELQKKANDYFGKVNNLPGNENGKKAELAKQLLTDYIIADHFKLSFSSEKNTSFNLFRNAVFSQQFVDLPIKPPMVSASC